MLIWRIVTDNKQSQVNFYRKIMWLTIIKRSILSINWIQAKRGLVRTIAEGRWLTICRHNGVTNLSIQRFEHRWTCHLWKAWRLVTIKVKRVAICMKIMHLPILIFMWCKTRLRATSYKKLVLPIKVTGCVSRRQAHHLTVIIVAYYLKQEFRKKKTKLTADRWNKL